MFRSGPARGLVVGVDYHHRVFEGWGDSTNYQNRHHRGRGGGVELWCVPAYKRWGRGTAPSLVVLVEGEQ